MPTLYVEDVPSELYESLRARAKEKRSSISAEVLLLLAQGIPTPEELSRRRKTVEGLRKLRLRREPVRQHGEASEESLAADRSR